jgi:hypothetical protein
MSTLKKQKQVNKSSQQKASLPHRAFALQIGQNHGLESFAPLRSLLHHASAKVPMPLPRTGHHSSARFRPKLFC